MWAGFAVATVGLGMAVARADLPAAERGEHYTIRAGIAALGQAGLLTVAAVFAAGAIVEGGVDTWGVLFLRDHLDVAALAGAGAYVCGQLLATTARATLGATAHRVGERRGARLGLAFAAGGLVLEATSGHAVVAGIGLAAASVGAAVYWPLLLADVSRGQERPGIIVGGISAAGYIGFLAGPPLVGWFSSTFGLRTGLLVLAAVATVAALFPLRTVSPASSRASS